MNQKTRIDRWRQPGPTAKAPPSRARCASQSDRFYSACAKTVPTMAANAMQVGIAFIEGPPNLLPTTLNRERTLRQEDIGVGLLLGSGSNAMVSMNTSANKLAASNGNMNLKPSDTSCVVHAHRVPMALAIMKTDPMVARMANVIF